MSRIAGVRELRYAFRLRERLNESRRTMPMIAAFSVDLF